MTSVQLGVAGRENRLLFLLQFTHTHTHTAERIYEGREVNGRLC